MPILTAPSPYHPLQARRLFHMIVHPENYAFYTDDQSERQVCGRILETLDQWTMRVALLDLRLLYRQTAKQAADKHTQWLNTLAQATIEAFQQGAGDAYRPAARYAGQSSCGLSALTGAVRLLARVVLVSKADVNTNDILRMCGMSQVLSQHLE